MTPQDRLRISIASARYVEAIERDDQDTLDELWELAARDTDLLEAFNEIHTGLIEERDAQTTAVVAEAVERHMPSAEIVRASTGPVTVADVALELFKYPPNRMPSEAHQMNERLRAAKDELPTELGLPGLIAWAEAKFGPAPAEYWKAFRQTALKVRMRANSEVEFQLAARRTKPRPEGSP